MNQPPIPMIVTNSFYLWFYYGFVIGGWLIFFLVAAAAVIWLLYDSMKRRLPVVGWRMAVILTACLLIPAILYRFTVTPDNMLISPLALYAEPIFYLGILGGVLPLVIAIGYYITYKGTIGCHNGHIYDARLGSCPQCRTVSTSPVVGERRESGGSEGRTPPPPPPPPTKRKVQAWLVAKNGRDYQLCQGSTLVGKSSQNDIRLVDDPTVSRQHARIDEQNMRFTLVDLGSKNYTRVNGRIVRAPVILEPDDELQLGDNTFLRFLTSRR